MIIYASGNGTELSAEHHFVLAQYPNSSNAHSNTMQKPVFAYCPHCRDDGFAIPSRPAEQQLGIVATFS